MYSFGDSTAFPLRDNFLDTLMATVKACSALFACECELEDSEEATQEANHAASVELMRLSNLQKSLNEALSTASGALCSRAADDLRQTSASILQRSRQSLEAQRDALIRKATPLNLGSRIRQILATFWLERELPKTQWSYRWRIDAEGVPRTELRAAVRDIAVNFGATPVPSELWSDQIAVSSLMASLSIEIPIWTRRCRGTSTKREELSEYHIIEVESSSARQRLLLRRNGKAKHALLVTLSDTAGGASTISLVDEKHDVLGDTHVLSPSDLESLSTLWNLVQEHRDSLLQSRTQLTSITIDNRSVENVEHPSEVAELLLSCIAPLAREIRLRSRVPGELILKKQTGKGTREELFLPRETIQEEYRHLPDRYRRVFDAMGLGSESTVDFVTMITEPAKATRQRSGRVVSSAADAIEGPDDPFDDADSSNLILDDLLSSMTASINRRLDEDSDPSANVIIEIDAA